MVKTRRPLGCLASYCNVGGEEALRTRVGPQQTPVQRHTIRMYQRREEAWRGLTRQRVAAFLRLFVLCFVETENGLPLETVTYQMLKRKLVKGVIPWIYNRLVFTIYEQYWPITLQQFRELDSFLAEHMPRVHKEDEWDTVAYFFKTMLNKGRNTNDWRIWRRRRLLPWTVVWDNEHFLFLLSFFIVSQGYCESRDIIYDHSANLVL